MAAERHIYHTTVLRESFPIVEEEGEGGRVVVFLRLYEQRRFWKDNPEDFTQDGEPTLVNDLAIRFQPSTTKEFFAEHLSHMGVPAEEHEAIYMKFLRRYFVNLDRIGHYVPYVVNILDISLSVLGSANYREIVDWVARHPIIFPDPWGPKFIPASRSCINSLKKIRVDSLEGDLGSCAVCLDDFAESADQLDTFLPCKNLYHADCIAQSLRTSHLCPLCRHPLPTVEADEQ